MLRIMTEQIEENLIGRKRQERRRVLHSNLAQAIASPIFVLAAAGAALALGIGVFGDIVDAFRSAELLDYGYHHMLVRKAVQSDTFLFVVPILCPLPFAGTWLDDQKSGYRKLYLSRTNRSSYLLGKMYGCMISGGLALVSGILLALAVSTLVFYPMEAAGSGTEAGEWLQPFLQSVLTAFCSGAFWSMTGMAVSAFTSSKYMAYAGPFIFYYLFVILCERYFKSCYILYPRQWLVPEQFPFGIWGVAVLLAELAALLCGSFYIRETKRLGAM